MKTLPKLVMEWGENLDEARALLRDRPDLASLAEKYGPARVFNAAAARKILAALIERRESRLASV